MVELFLGDDHDEKHGNLVALLTVMDELTL